MATQIPTKIPTIEVERAQSRLYDAECALHAAHQTGVWEWENAAREKLVRVLADLRHAETVAFLSDAA